MPSYRESYVFRIDTVNPATLWSGNGLIMLPGDAVLPDDTLVHGGGELINIPDLEQLINGLAQRIEITLSGVSEEAIRMAEEEALHVPGAAVHIGRISFGEDWQIAEPVAWEWAGQGKSLTVSSEPADKGRTRTLTLRLGAGETTRSRAPLAFFTDADQRREFPTDNFFDHVAGINNGTSRRWGPAR